MDQPIHRKNQYYKTAQSDNSLAAISPTISRRNALKVLAATTGVTGLNILPGKWERPLVEIGTLPAFAQTSSLNYPFTSEVIGIDPDDALLFESRGWLVFNITDGIPGPATTAVTSATEAIIVQGIPPNRPFPSVPPSWGAKRDITIPYIFLSPSGVIPKDGTVVWLYGVSADRQFEGAITGVVVDGKVSFSYPVPDAFTGTFYISADFFEKEIILTNETVIDSTYYFATGIFGENAEIPGSPGGCDSQQSVDVILVVELSSSAFGTELPAKLAFKQFIDKLDLSSGQVGLVSFAGIFELNQPLTNNANIVKAAIDTLASTPVNMNPAHGIYGARLELTSTRHKSGNLPVMVILSRGFESLATVPPIIGWIEADEAKNAGIRIIAVGMNPSPVWEQNMQRWASSEGDYYRATSAANLFAIYDEIAEGIGCG